VEESLRHTCPRLDEETQFMKLRIYGVNKIGFAAACCQLQLNRSILEHPSLQGGEIAWEGRRDLAGQEGDSVPRLLQLYIDKLLRTCA
jgi:hypothetical protein